MKAVERLQARIAESETAWIETVVSNAPGDTDGVGHIRYAQGVIAGLREAQQEIQEMRKRYNEDDDADS